MLAYPMLNSWFYLRAFAKQLQDQATGSFFGQPWTHQKDTIQIPIEGAPSLGGFSFSIQAALPYLILETEMTPPRKRVPVLPGLQGMRIRQVQWHRNDRQILLRLAPENALLLIRAYGKNGNIFLLDQEFQLRDSFKKARKTPVIDTTQFVAEDILQLDAATLDAAREQHLQQPLKTVLRRLPIPLFDAALIAEICHRSDIPGSTLVVNLSSEDIHHLYSVLSELLAEIESPRFYFYPGNPPLFALLQMQTQEDPEPEVFRSLAEAVRQYIGSFYRHRSLEQKRTRLLRTIQTQLQQSTRKIEKQRRELRDMPTADNFRRWADAIMANLSGIETVEPRLQLPDPTQPQEMIEIPLDTHLSAVENANRYYAKSKSIGKSREQLKNSIAEALTHQEKLHQLARDIEQSNDARTLHKIEKKHFGDLSAASKRSDGERLPYSEYQIEGWTVLVGRSARDNDQLTFHVARPHDLWLHAENVRGSHVILRNPHKSDSIPATIIRKAARLAAHFSQAKHSGLVPVVYTFRKYVRKNKKMPPGAVFHQFEKSILVEPGLPGS